MNVMSPIHSNVEQDDLWYKDAIIYQLHVKAFADANNDGIGDFAGLTQKLDYLQDLGVTTLWLLPFYPSPGRDDGYDIADYGAVNPDFGTMKDLRRFIGEAKRRGLRVITELVINHTSDQHPWFKRARRSPSGSSARDWYVWSDTNEKYQGTRIIFTDTEKSNWTWDPEAKAFYWHRFFSHQPDLNFDNPRVVSAVVKVMKRWLDAGVDGFRLDAIPYLCEREGTSNENLPETHAVIKKIRAELDAYAKGKVLLAEANQWPEDVQQYFGDGDECHMAYHFPLMPRFYMAIAQEDRFPVTDILRQTPDIPSNCQWALFLRNHDELTLEMVTDVERDYLWSTYANDPRARINVGIRRRLSPLMDNDRRKIELMNSLLMSFPGTPIIYYGDEIGMGDNIYLGDRNGVRTPMQWAPDRNGGFSRADPARLYAPPIMDAVYGYEAVNVEAQTKSLSSLLSWMKKLIAVRKTSQAFGRGAITFVRPSNRSVLAYIRQYGDEIILCVTNLSRSAQATELDLSAWKERIPQEMLGRSNFPPIGDLPYLITLPPYGFYWFRLADKPKTSAPQYTPVPEFETLVVPAGSTWMTLSRARTIFERDVLPAHLARARWFPQSDARGIKTKVLTALPFTKEGSSRPWLTIFESDQADKALRYAMPVRVDWVRFDRERYNPKALAAVRQGAKEGTLFDVATDSRFIEMLIRNIRNSETTTEDGKSIEFIPTLRMAQVADAPIETVRAVETEQSNSTALVDETLVVKIYRKIEPGLNPEVEMGRFLTDTAQFSHTPALLGSVDIVDGTGRSALAIVHQFVPNQGDAWSLTSAYLNRFVEEQRLLSGSEGLKEEEQVSYLRYMVQIGRRVAEMQLALAAAEDDPAFVPEPVTASDVSVWTSDIMQRAERVFTNLEHLDSSTNAHDLDLASRLLAHKSDLQDVLISLLSEPEAPRKFRHHGDLHLGQLLVVKDDIFIIDFEGEPRRSLDERRRKAPAARDIAGLIRSIDYSTAAALQRALQGAPDDDGRLAQALAEWSAAAIEILLSSYHSTLGQSGLWPSNDQAGANLLRFFLIEKVFYEIEYELAHRPSWLCVPIEGALRILSDRGRAS